MKGPLGTLAAAVLVTLAAAPFAHGAEAPTRALYVERVDRICMQDTQRSQRILRGVRQMIDRERMVPAGRRFIRVSKTFAEALRRIVRVPRPPADDPRLRKWFKFLRIVKTRMRVLGKTLKEEKKVKATHASIQLERSSNAANNVGFVFGFRHCRFTRSRFG